MVKVALLVRLEVKPGHEQTVADFLVGALPIVEAEGLREKLGDKSEANARGWEKVMSTVRGSAAAGGVDEGDACWVVEQLHELCDLIPGEQMVDVRKWMKEVSRFSFGVGKSVDHARRHGLRARKQERALTLGAG